MSCVILNLNVPKILTFAVSISRSLMSLGIPWHLRTTLLALLNLAKLANMSVATSWTWDRPNKTFSTCKNTLCKPRIFIVTYFLSNSFTVWLIDVTDEVRIFVICFLIALSSFIEILSFHRVLHERVFVKGNKVVYRLLSLTESQTWALCITMN